MTKKLRIVSLVPSITELLFNLGLYEEVVGITKFCVHPKEWFTTKTRVGGTKNININKIFTLQPTIVICSKEENVKSQIDELSIYFDVLVTDVKTYDEALEMIINLGSITNKKPTAKAIVSKIKAGFKALKPAKNIINCVYCIWYNPYITVGGDTFIDSMLQKAGFNNIYKHQARYPTITISDIVTLNPPVIMLSTEPFPFKQKHIKELQMQLPKSKMLLVDGEIFSWYGSRMLHAPNYFKELYNKISSI